MIREFQSPMIRDVWYYNLHEELALLYDSLIEFPIVSIDTEFPGFLINTPRDASEERLYEFLQFNVNETKLIQLGLTLSDDIGRIAATWQFNFRDFDEDEDAQDTSSVSFLKNDVGIDFEKLRMEGISSQEFTQCFLPICQGDRISKWITFHGIYDIAYLLKLMKIREIPKSKETFATTAQHLLGTVSDIKHMAQYCDGLMNGKLGLERLARLLNVKRIGISHQAGSDSLLTAQLYAKMKEKFNANLCSDESEGFLYGLSHKIQMKRSSLKITDPKRRQSCLKEENKRKLSITDPNRETSFKDDDSKWRVLTVENGESSYVVLWKKISVCPPYVPGS